MAESFVDAIAEILLRKMASLAVHQDALAWGLEADLKMLEELLCTVKAVLLDAEEKQAQNYDLCIWLRRLKNYCYDAEDVLDEMEYESLRKKVLKQYGNTKIRVRSFFSSSNLRLKMLYKVKKLRERLDEIAEHKYKFNLTALDDFRQARSRLREITDSRLDTSNVIGRDGDKERILKFLLPSKGDKTISVIPIVGLAGMGKTTLAKMLYNDLRVDKHFDLKIWVCVSFQFEKIQIMVSMIKSLSHQYSGSLPFDELQRLIQGNLNSKRFLLVLDDFWSDDRWKWIKFLELLEGGAAGSKVIVTTRYHSVADTVGTVPSYNLKRISHEQCLSLFKKFAFREGEEESHSHLMEIGDDIIQKCEGIPLAVKTMGTLLYSNIDERYWTSIKEDGILPFLKLNYNSLPSHLKLCLAICSVYPKGYEFCSDKLCQIWMAHGLIQSLNEQRDMEVIGVQYIKELYSASFFKDFKEDAGVMYFKMHDLMHDLALTISRSECFVVNTHIEIPNGIRYLAFPEKNSFDEEVSSSLQKENGLRAVICPSEVLRPSSKSFVNLWISTSKYLRTLDLSKSNLVGLSRSIGDLKHLRYLDLSNNDRIERLPDSICKLHNLLFLNLSGSTLKEFPRDIKNLIKLIDLSITTMQTHLPNDGIGCLGSLRTLSITDCSNLNYLFEDIQCLICLRSLHVLGCYNLISLPRNLTCLNALEHLSIVHCNMFKWMGENDSQDVKLSLRSLKLVLLINVVTLPQWLEKSSKTLQRLDIVDCKQISSFPEWLTKFTSLENINIVDCPVLCKRCKRREGEDWDKIAHVPNIHITPPSSLEI